MFPCEVKVQYELAYVYQPCITLQTNLQRFCYFLQLWAINSVSLDGAKRKHPKLTTGFHKAVQMSGISLANDTKMCSLTLGNRTNITEIVNR